MRIVELPCRTYVGVSKGHGEMEIVLERGKVDAGGKGEGEREEERENFMKFFQVSLSLSFNLSLSLSLSLCPSLSTIFP